MRESKYTAPIICWMMRFSLFAASAPRVCSGAVLRNYIQLWTKWLQTASAFIAERETAVTGR